MRTISDVCNEIMQTMAPQLEEIGMRMILVVSGVTSHEGEKGNVDSIIRSNVPADVELSVAAALLELASDELGADCPLQVQKAIDNIEGAIKSRKNTCHLHDG